MFDLRCAEHGIEHRFTRINHPWTNGQGMSRPMLRKRKRRCLP
jgi:transposase InsO family protein